jgi:hypothetical protein
MKMFKIAKQILAGTILSTSLISGIAVAGSNEPKPVDQVEDGFPNRNGPLSAIMLFIPQSELAEFDRPADEGPHLSLLHKAHVGDVVAIKIMFAGAQNGADGAMDVTYDLKVTQPDGAVYSNTDEKGLAAVKSVPSEPTFVYDNRLVVVALRFEDKDLKGVYRAQAILHDNASGRDIPLTAEIELIP